MLIASKKLSSDLLQIVNYKIQMSKKLIVSFILKYFRYGHSLTVISPVWSSLQVGQALVLPQHHLRQWAAISTCLESSREPVQPDWRSLKVHSILNWTIQGNLCGTVSIPPSISILSLASPHSHEGLCKLLPQNKRSIPILVNIEMNIFTVVPTIFIWRV